MLGTIFLFCAVIGGTVMVCQFGMTLLGLGDDSGDVDVDAGGDFDTGGHADAAGHHHSTDWLFGVLSFRTAVAFLAFFGLGGYAAVKAPLPEPVSLVIAIASGLGAMYGVYFLMRSLLKLQADGTRKIDNALGCRGSVLVPIPPGSSGVGKVHVTMQARLVELAAMTDKDEQLGSGRRIEVTEIVGPNTVLVVPVVEHTDAVTSDSNETAVEPKLSETKPQT